MRKITLILIFILCLTGLFYADKSFALDTKELSKEEVSKLPEDSMDKIYQDLIICLFVPYIQKEVNNYYQKYLTEKPTVF